MISVAVPRARVRGSLPFPSPARAVRVAYLGEIAGLSTAVLWSFGGFFFASAGRRIGPAAVNVIRILIAVSVLMTVHAVLRGWPWPRGVSSARLALLAASGVSGLTLGDLFFFHCCVVIGPRLGALLMATAPAMTVILGWIFLGEALGPRAIVGMGLTWIGILAVLADRRSRFEWQTPYPPSARRFALVSGLLGALGQAGGLVLSKLAMVDVATGERFVDPFSATVVRMTAGAVGVVVLAALTGRIQAAVRGVRDRVAMRFVCLAVLVGPTTGVFLSQVAVLETDAGVAATLMSLVPVLMLPLARIAYGARPNRVAVLGTILAVAGTAVLFLRAAP